MKTLYLIDGYAQFFRAYHAIRSPMTSPVTKEPTNLTFGFVGMLLKLLREEGKVGADGSHADYVAVALDVSGDRGTFRSQLYPEYKATRAPTPEDLPVQVDRCLSILSALGVPVLGAEGFEADDVIASVVRRVRETHPGVRVRIISKDKDLKQLLADDAHPVELFDIHKDEVIDVAALKDATGLNPDHIIDMLALMGDTVDNVPGVPGIGEKTAAKLIAEFGSLDAVVEAARSGEIKGKRQENILASVDALPLSKELVTLRADLDVPLDLASAEPGAFKLAELIQICKELGFNRYQEEVRELLGQGGGESPRAAKAPPASAGGTLFDQLESSEAPRAQSGTYSCVRTKEDLGALAEALRGANAIAFDTETTSLSPREAELCGLSFSIEAGSAWYVPVRSPEPGTHLDEAAVLGVLGPILEDSSLAKCGHNLKYDILVMRRAGVGVRGLGAPGGCDSYIASFLIDPTRSSHGMDALALAVLHRTNISITELIGTGKNQRRFDEVPVDAATEYAAEDADVSLQLAQAFLPQLKALQLMSLWSDVELPLIEVLADMEWDGVLVDPDELDRQRERLQGRIDGLRAQIQDEAMGSLGRSFNPDSPRQLAGVLFNKPGDEEPGLGLKVIKRGKTGPSTDVEVLEKLAADPEIESPIPQLILENRQLTKLVGTYLVALKDAINPETKRIHASFHQTGAATGRLSSSDPNLQNIPIRTEIGREIRKAFIAPPGHVLITADYSQIELRLLAHLSEDPKLIEAFEAGEDIHAAVAAQINNVPLEEVTREQRSGAKMVNFGIVYGVTPYGLARRLGISNAEAEEIITGYKRKFARINTFLQECIDQATRYGYVKTMLGRRRPVEGFESNNPQQRALAERVAINSVVQGSAADLIKVAMVDLHRRLSPHATDRPEIPGVRMLIQIHDELVFEAEASVAQAARDLIVDRMEHVMRFTVPIRVDAAIGANWFEGK